MTFTTDALPAHDAHSCGIRTKSALLCLDHRWTIQRSRNILAGPTIGRTQITSKFGSLN